MAPRRVTEVVGSCSRLVQSRRPGRLSSALTKRVAAVALNRGVYTYRDKWGHVVEADLSDHMERAGFLGVHNPVLLREVTRLVEPGDWVIDAGANVGLVASALCAATGPSGAVWAVEPLPANVAKLRALKEANRLDHLTVFPVALSSVNDTGRLRLPRVGGSAYGSFVARWETAAQVEVTTRRLDDLVASSDTAGQSLKLVKIDAEGFEPEILRGATETLSRMRPLVLCEFNDVLLHHAGTSAEELLEAFAAIGFGPVPLTGAAARPLPGRSVDVLMAHASTELIAATPPPRWRRGTGG